MWPYIGVGVNGVFGFGWDAGKLRAKPRPVARQIDDPGVWHGQEQLMQQAKRVEAHPNIHPTQKHRT